MFENLLKEFSVEPAHGSNVGAYKFKLCTLILSKQTHWLPEAVISVFFHTFGLPLTLLYVGLNPGDFKK